MKNECKEKNWRECCKCNFFDECDKKENNRIGAFTIFKKDFRNFLNKFKKSVKPSESAVDREFREIKLEEWKRHSEPEKYIIDDSELINIRVASRRDIRIIQNKIKLGKAE